MQLQAMAVKVASQMAAQVVTAGMELPLRTLVELVASVAMLLMQMEDRVVTVRLVMGVLPEAEMVATEGTQELLREALEGTAA